MTLATIRRPFTGMAFLLIGWLLMPLSSQAQTIDNFKINTINWFGNDSSGWGEISFDLVSHAQDSAIRYLNVFDPNQPPGNNWLLQNFPIHPDLPAGTYMTRFNINRYKGGDIVYVVTDSGLVVGPLIPISVGVPVSPTVGIVEYRPEDWGGRDNGNPPQIDGPPEDVADAFDPTRPLVRSVFLSGMPDEVQGPNECAPTAAGNGFQWLNETYRLNLPERMNEADEIRDLLKTNAYMQTHPNLGTSDLNAIKGRLQFIRDYNLPLSVEFQDDALNDVNHANSRAVQRGNQPSFSWIFEQLENRKAVEVGISWRGGGGHWLTLVGAVEFMGIRMLFYHDPIDGPGRIRFSFVAPGEAGDPFPNFLEFKAEPHNSMDMAVATGVNRPTGIAEESSAALPGRFTLFQNTPNPFNPYTVISFELSAAGDVELSVYDLMGRHVRTLVRGMQRAGTHTVRWDGRDRRGRRLAGGIYFYRLRFGDRMLTRRMILLP